MWILLVLILVILLTFVYAGLTTAPWVPSRRKDTARIVELLDIKPGQVFFELGCGDARISSLAAKAGAISHGFEISLLPYLIAKVKSFFYPQSLFIHFSNFWQRDFSQADYVFVFLMPGVMEKLRNKFDHELKKGAVVIAYLWQVPGWTPYLVDTKKDFPKIYLYRKE